MKMKKSAVLLTVGFLAGVLVGPPTAQAAAEYLKATRSTQSVYVDGSRVSLTAYSIGGNNYVKLRDVGQILDINVYWDGANVQIDTSASYSGEAPTSVQPIVQVTPMPTTQDVETMRQGIVDRTNAVRKARGLSALPTDSMLMKAAQVRAKEMAATYTYSHNRPDGSSCRTTTDCQFIAENIHRIWQNNLDYKNVGLAELCVQEWIASSGHLQNMIQPDSAAIGVGVAKGLDSFGEECWYCVQWFLRDGYAITWVDTPKIP